MRTLLLIICMVPSFLLAQPSDSSKLNTPRLSQEKIKPIVPKTQMVVSPVNSYLAYRTLPELHKFLDTASRSSIEKFLTETKDSVLELVQFESLTARQAYASSNPYSANDKDGDGLSNFTSGGVDCDDLDAYRFPGAPEFCEGYSVFVAWQKKYIMIYRYHDEDCDPCTVSGIKPDGDKDGDKQVCFTCVNYTPRMPACDEVFILPTSSTLTYGNPDRRYTVRGWDCDDHNPALIRASQICIDERTIAVCENGKWKYYPCRKCVTQPNGAGVVVE